MFLIPAFNMFGKPVPGTRKSICIVLLIDVLMWRIGWRASRITISVSQPKCCPTTIHKQKPGEPSLITETNSSYMPVSLHHGTNTSISGRYSPYRCSPQTSINGGLVCPYSGQHLISNPYQIIFWRLPPNSFHGHQGL